MRQGHDKLRIEYRYVILDENDEVVGRLHQDFAAAHDQLREIERNLPQPDEYWVQIISTDPA